VFRFSAVLLASFALLATSASAALWRGTGNDPTGDGPTPARDVTTVYGGYDDQRGELSAELTFAAAPDPQFFFVVIGTRAADGTCGAPFAALGGFTDQAAGSWARSGGETQSGVTVAVQGTTLQASVTDASLAGSAFDCATGYVTPQDDTSTRYDTIDPPIGLAGPAPPPVTPAPPSPPPAAPTPTPAAPVAPPSPPAPAPATKPKATKKAPALAVTVSGVPSTIKRNRSMSLKLELANTGTAAATGVRLRAGTARGLSVRPAAFTVKTLKAGKAVTRRVKVRLTAKAKTTTTLSLKATGAKRLRATGRVALRIGKAKKPKPTTTTPTAGPAPAAPTSPLAGTYWWYTINHVDSAWDNHGVYFLDDQWAFHGIPKGGLPTACSAQVAGCEPYTYNPATGAVTLGTAAGTFKDGRLSLADEGDVRDFTRLVIPDAGARYEVNLVHRGFQGMCGLYLGCTTWEHWLQLLPDGQFIYSKSTTTTMGDGGLGPFTYVGSYPPDEHGTYAVQPNGRIHLAYADGTAKDFTFAVQLGPAGQPDPGGEGVFLDEDNFYKDEMP
jgi:hypothetical protein